jgi:hypothetical protein
MEEMLDRLTPAAPKKERRCQKERRCRVLHTLRPFAVAMATKASLTRSRIDGRGVGLARRSRLARARQMARQAPDDIENLVDQMARRERIEFAKEFGLCTVRPGYANTEYISSAGSQTRTFSRR